MNGRDNDNIPNINFWFKNKLFLCRFQKTKIYIEKQSYSHGKKKKRQPRRNRANGCFGSNKTQEGFSKTL
jgi:hypothetical protein